MERPNTGSLVVEAIVYQEARHRAANQSRYFRVLYREQIDQAEY